ncbi:MAG: hypothetical protein E7160_04885 [Firmicutes bacterium]|nr:hypothetical protein [Bacillota bacterium]
MDKIKRRSKGNIRIEGFEIMITDKEIIEEDYDFFIDISPDEFKVFNDVLFDLYDKYNLVDHYLEDLDSYLDDLYYMALFDDNLAIIDYEYFINRMILLFTLYGHTEIVSTNFSEVKGKINSRTNPKLANFDTYKQYKKIISNLA